LGALAAVAGLAWRDLPLDAVTYRNAARMFCLGCCMLMALLFVGDLMHLVWIAAISLLMPIEKTLPWGGWTERQVGTRPSIAFACAL
jgi:predicted metal-binding membrane protein